MPGLRANSTGWKTSFTVSVVLAVVILLVGSSTWKWMKRQPKYYSSWPETRGCKVVGARTVREATGLRGEPYFLYYGEYRLEFNVNGERYSVYARSPFLDVDESVVLQRLQELPKSCEYSIYYNPEDPTQAHAETRRTF